MSKPEKTHFELSPANARRLEEYLELYNSDPHRVSPRIKIGHVVNQALDRWLSERIGLAKEGKGVGKSRKA